MNISSWITRRFKGCLTLALVVILILHTPFVSAVDDLYSLQGNVYNSTGDPLPWGNLSVYLYENNSCSDYFYWSANDFNGSIVNGQYDVMLGNETLTALVVDPSLRYLWIGTRIDGTIQLFNSTAGKCRSFSNPFYMSNATIDQRILFNNDTFWYASGGWLSQNLTNSPNRANISSVAFVDGTTEALLVNGTVIIRDNASIGGHGAVGSLSSVVPNSIWYVYDEFGTNADNSGLLVTMRQTTPPLNPNYPRALSWELNYNGTGAQAYRMASMNGALRILLGAGDVDGARGGVFSLIHESESRITTAIGSRSAVAITGGGNITTAVNFWVSNDAITNGTIDTLVGIGVQNPNIVFPGQVTNYYSFYSPPITGVSGQQYAYYEAGGEDSVFKGNLTAGGNVSSDYFCFLNGGCVTSWAGVNDTYYGDEWWINKVTINASNYNFTFNETTLASGYYNKSKVDELTSGIQFDLYLYNTTDADLPAYNVMNSSSSPDPERSIVLTIPADDTLIQGFVANATINRLEPGVYFAHIHANATTAGKQDVRIYWTGNVRYANGTETLLVTSEESDVLTASDDHYDIHGTLAEGFTVNTSSDKFVAKFYANLDGAGGNPDAWLLIEGNTASRFVMRGTVSAFNNYYLQLDGSNADRNIDIQPYNFSADWFYGQFNWTVNSTCSLFNGSTLYLDWDCVNATYYTQWFNGTDTNASTACAAGEYLDGGGTCINVNQTIDYRSTNTTGGASTRKLSATYNSLLGSSTNSLESNVHLLNLTFTLPQTFSGFSPLFVPRTINYTLSNLDVGFGVYYEFNVTGVDQDNNDYYIYNSGLLPAVATIAFESDKAFAHVYNYTLNMSTAGGFFPQIQVEIGRGNWIGLPNYPLTSVYKAVGNRGASAQEVIVYNTTYGKVYLNETWTGTDYTYWYES